MARVISLTVLVTSINFVPLSGKNSYSVTIGPGRIPVTLPYTLYSAKCVSIDSAWALNSGVTTPLPNTDSSKNSGSGNSYSLFSTTTFLRTARVFFCLGFSSSSASSVSSSASSSSSSSSRTGKI